MASYIHVPDEAPFVPKIDVTVDESDYRAGALQLMKALRPSWKPSEVKIKVPLHSFKRFPFNVPGLYMYILTRLRYDNTVSLWQRLFRDRRRRWLVSHFKEARQLRAFYLIPFQLC